MLFRFGQCYIEQTPLVGGFQWRVVPPPAPEVPVLAIGTVPRQVLSRLAKERAMSENPSAEGPRDYLQGKGGFACLIVAPLNNGQPENLTITMQWGRPTRPAQLDILAKQLDFLGMCLAMAKQDAAASLPGDTEVLNA